MLSLFLYCSTRPKVESPVISSSGATDEEKTSTVDQEKSPASATEDQEIEDIEEEGNKPKRIKIQEEVEKKEREG